MNKNTYVTREEFEAFKREVSERIYSDSFSKSALSPKKEKPRSMREMFLEYSPKTKLDQCFIIMFLLDEENIDGVGFDFKMIKKTYKNIKETLPGNLTDVISTLEKKAYVQVLSGKGKNRMYSLTNSGVDVVEGLKKQ